MDRILQLKTTAPNAIDLSRVIAITVNQCSNSIHYWMGPSEDDYFNEPLGSHSECKKRYEEVLQLWSNICNKSVDN